MKPNFKKRPSHPHIICQPLFSHKFMFQDSTPLEFYAQSISTASTGFYLFLVLRSSPFKVGGYCHNHRKDPSQFVFTARYASTKIWPIGHIIKSGQIYFLGMEWPFGHAQFSCSLLALRLYPVALAFLANSQSHNP
ncbi:hypothetical protein O181_090368 [Austropuccinia psidii MF-1]|uniref:Uncharacterized protein n=1 Tax=Austropuccinia psidii MF-1 TaxID=1389203 RepID=A0A9Q3P6D7_9BASI|nr:hypothetical protein [Austropuccinia psidii MF-1]